jgi:hypothetical protein
MNHVSSLKQRATAALVNIHRAYMVPRCLTWDGLKMVKMWCDFKFSNEASTSLLRPVKDSMRPAILAALRQGGSPCSPEGLVIGYCELMPNDVNQRNVKHLGQYIPYAFFLNTRTLCESIVGKGWSRIFLQYLPTNPGPQDLNGGPWSSCKCQIKRTLESTEFMKILPLLIPTNRIYKWKSAAASWRHKELRSPLWYQPY